MWDHAEDSAAGDPLAFRMKEIYLGETSPPKLGEGLVLDGEEPPTPFLVKYTILSKQLYCSLSACELPQFNPVV